MTQWVCWRIGRGAFNQWHRLRQVDRTRCGRIIPSSREALLNWMDVQPEIEQCCAVCVGTQPQLELVA